MLFLIQYDRSKGEIVSQRRFADSERERANDTRLALEIELNRMAVDHEIVLLDAPDESALRLTHSRYFKNLEGVAASANTSSVTR